jgi:hypothetical protein
MASVGQALAQAGSRPSFEPVVAEGALVRLAVEWTEGGDAEGTGRNTVAAAVADILLDHDRIELGADDGASRACLHATGVDTMLADVAQHEPVALEGREGRWTSPFPIADPLDEGDMTPGGRAEIAGIVVTHAGEAEIVHRQLVPLLAGDLARFTADAEGGIGEEAEGAWPGSRGAFECCWSLHGAFPSCKRPLRIVQVNDFAS